MLGGARNGLGREDDIELGQAGRDAPCPVCVRPPERASPSGVYGRPVCRVIIGPGTARKLCVVGELPDLARHAGSKAVVGVGASSRCPCQRGRPIELGGPEEREVGVTIHASVVQDRVEEEKRSSPRSSNPTPARRGCATWSAKYRRSCAARQSSLPTPRTRATWRNIPLVNPP
ncbi:hypothetical protein N657DRAFT_256695 [Parathielavia appendiculata]|uniref:Uncharacterized protein n=1 Tax=Parathielavia appendiculata TaxID=2587402 RepID=A0AAN6YZ17_9PEZI|nr:hypothetical protein N657DRAFT_256695 [Parathielavia appendiculata]